MVWLLVQDAEIFFSFRVSLKVGSCHLSPKSQQGMSACCPVSLN